MKKWPWFFLSFTIIVLDQITKYWAASGLILYHKMALMPMLNLTLAYNTGAAFSFLAQAGDWHRWLFAGFSSVMSIVLIVWIIRIPRAAILQLLALSLILGGALGNLWDRAFLGYVIDFIEVYYKNHYWPVFNVADSAISVGAVLLLVDLIKHSKVNV